MSVRSNVERRVSEEMSTEVEQKLYFSLLFCTKEKRGSVSTMHCISTYGEAGDHSSMRGIPLPYS